MKCSRHILKNARRIADASKLSLPDAGTGKLGDSRVNQD
jgi:hypothetical protein